MADGYDIGFGKPPKETRFVKGRSGNPRDRPKGSKNLATTFHEITRQLIRVSENGKSRTVSKLDAIMIQLVNKALTGDLKAAKEFLQWSQLFEGMADRDATVSPDASKNQAVMDLLIKTARAARSSAQPVAATSEGTPNADINA